MRSLSKFHFIFFRIPPQTTRPVTALDLPPNWTSRHATPALPVTPERFPSLQGLRPTTPTGSPNKPDQSDGQQKTRKHILTAPWW